MAHKTPNEYIASFPEEVQKKLKSIRKTIKNNAKEAEDAMGYGVAAFKLKGVYLVYYAAFKKHIGLYPTPSALQHFSQELSAYETAKGTVKFPFEKPIPFDLIAKIVKFRVKEVLKK